MAVDQPPIQEKTANSMGVFPQVWIRWFDNLRDVVENIRVSTYENRVIVKTAADLSGTLDSSKLYMLDGTIDMGGQSIEVPPGGLSIAGLNGARDPFGLTSSANNYTMFTSPAGSYSGDLVIESMTITTSGTNSKVFDLDNDGNSNALDITGVNFTNCTSLGELTDYRQLLFNNIGFISIDDGLTFNGTWTGIAVVTSIAISFPAATLFKEGTSFTVNNVRSDINFLSVNSASVLFDFQESNITAKGGFSLNNVRTTAADAVPNISGSSSYARFSDCNGIRNTYVGGQWTITSQAATTISTANTPVKLAGTTTYNDLQWFTQTTSNAFVYDGNQTIEIEAKGVISVSGTTNDQASIFFRQWDDSASAYIDAPKAQATLNGGLLGSRAEGIPFFAYFQLDNNDRIEVWIENDTAARNVTGLDGGLVSVVERPS